MRNLHTADHCHSLYYSGILCKSQRLEQGFLTAGYFITCFTPKCSCYTSVVYPLLLTKRNKERRQCGRDTARDPDGLRPWHFVSFCNFGILSSPPFWFHLHPSPPSLLSVTLFFSLAAPGQYAYVVTLLRVSWRHWIAWLCLTKGGDSSKLHDTMPEQSRCPMTASYQGKGSALSCPHWRQPCGGTPGAGHRHSRCMAIRLRSA